jgi:peptide/nickel transport system permease protein
MTFRNYIIKRLLTFIPSLLFATILIFTLIHLAPGDPIDLMFSKRPGSRELADQIRHQLGLDKPIHIQYLIWLNKILHGDLGFSYLSGKSVALLIKARIGNTALLMLSGLFISLVGAIIIGVTSAVKHNTIVDDIITPLGIFGYSMPSFWLAMMLILFFGLRLNWFPVMGVRTLGETYTWFNALQDRLWHLVLPVLSVAIGYMGYLTRIVRTSMLEVLKQDYVVTARAKGVGEWIIIYKHALRNALLPLVTIVGISVRSIVGGSVVVETIFAWPGLGKLAVDMAMQRDFPTLMGISIILVGIVLLSGLITDMTYAILDPRIRY